MTVRFRSPAQMFERHMGKENSVNFPPPHEVSSSERALLELHNSLWEANRFLMDIFFQEDTWNVRQAAVYGFFGLESEKGSEDDSSDTEQDFVVQKILTELGNRIDYFEAAYHFPDSLAALGVMTSESWVSMKANRDSSKTRADIAADLLDEAKIKIAEETTRFMQFLGSETFRRAFSINVTFSTGEYHISDVSLDPEELLAQWRTWFS